MIVFRLVHHNYPFFDCAAEQMYITAVNNNSNLASCPSPTDGEQIMPNDSLLRTSAFFIFSVKYPLPNNTDSMIHIPQ